VGLELYSRDTQLDHTIFGGKSQIMLALCHDVKAADELCWHNILKPTPFS